MLNKIIKKIRYRWAILTKGLGYSDSMVKALYGIYLNHSKIIHFRDGYPVYSLSTPALFSPPSANFFARLIYRVIQNRPMPNLMSFAVNDMCNARCEHCSFFTSVDDKSRKVLSLNECRDVIAQAQELGVSIINIVGGEPLLRNDLPEILRSVDKEKSIITIFTNGTFLAKKAKILRECGVDGVYVSIDSADPQTHDAKRGVNGMYNDAMMGISEALKTGMTVGISATLGPDDFARGELDKIMELARKVHVHEVVVFDALPAGRLKNQKDLKLNRAWVEKMIVSGQRYLKDENYPGLIFYSYASSHRSVGCSGGVSYFYVNPYGDIYPCDFLHMSFGNVLKEPLYKIWENMNRTPGFGQAKWGGCKVADVEWGKTDAGSPVDKSACGACPIKLKCNYTKE